MSSSADLEAATGRSMASRSVSQSASASADVSADVSMSRSDDGRSDDGQSRSDNGAPGINAALRQAVEHLEISIATVAQLRKLEAYDFCFIIDDSSSMLTPTATSLTVGADAFGVQSTRWSELKATVGHLVELALALDHNGIDVFFLNQEMVHVNSVKEATNLFKKNPEGDTYMTRALLKVNHESERPKLIVIATDGLPTEPAVLMETHLKLICQRGNKVALLACTDEKKVLEFFNRLDKQIKGLDVNDDYLTERARVSRRSATTFSRGDYIAKILLGAVDPAWDNLDGSAKGCSCVLL